MGGKALTGTATLLSSLLNEGHAIVAASNALPSNGVNFFVSSKLGHEISIEIDDKVQEKDEKILKEAYRILKLLPSEVQDLFYMNYDDVSNSELAEGLNIPELLIRGIREKLSPLE